jgi:glycosyltransferase involved in cell wall biosynthesis
MLSLQDITPLVLTFNEAPNLERTLKRLQWATEIVVLDSGSTDATQQIATSFPNVRLETRAFDDHTTQWNHGVTLVATAWVLALDADYVLGTGFEEELSGLPGDADAYDAAFRYLVFGKALRASLYPPRAVLFQKSRCTYVEDGHTQVLHVPGMLGHLQTRIDHDDRKPLTRWLSSQDKYALLESKKLSATDPAKLRLQDKLRLTMWAAIPASLIYTLLVKGTLWDGWRGWYYALQRLLAEMLLALRLIEKKLKDDH